MAIPAKPTLTAPPTAPVRGEDRASFATKANAYVVFIGTNVTDLTAAINWQNLVFTATETEATNAAQSVVDAAAEVVLAADQVVLAADQVVLAEAQVALAAGQVVLAADEVDLAADQVTLAEAAAAAAIVTANAAAWVSEASYSVNANAISGVDFGTYRAILTHTGVATDPSADATNWVKISSPAKASQAEAEAGTENTTFVTPLRAAQAIAALAPSVVNYQEFTTSGTWTKPDGATFVYVEAIGGGGGGKNDTGSAGSGDCGGGGGAGAAFIYQASDFSGTETVTIGAGTAGTADGVSGGNIENYNGGNTTFGSQLTAPGGIGGLNNFNNGGGGEVGGNGFVPTLASGGFSSGGGGGHASGSASSGGSCIVGGAGGGGASDGAGGVSQNGGNGGAGSSSAGVAGGDGVAPGGGGGGSKNDGGGGSGAAGRVRVWSW